MKNDTNNTYVLLNNTPITGNSYTHACQPYQATYTYMVRALTLENTWSGTYFNLSQGVSDTAYHSEPITIYVTPTVISTPTPFVYQFSVNAAGTYSFHWQFGDNNSSTNQNPIYTYTANGTYIATLMVMNGCNSVSYNFTIQVTGVDAKDNHIENGGFHIWPNPASNVLNLETTKKNHSFRTWKIKNPEGKTVLQGKALNEKTFQINIQKLQKGIYFLIMEADGNGVNEWKKFIVE